MVEKARIVLISIIGGELLISESCVLDFKESIIQYIIGGELLISESCVLDFKESIQNH